MSQVLVLTPDPAQVRVAREFCARQLSGLLGDGVRAEDLLDSALMITSELVTNSVRAGAGRVSLHTSHRAGGFRIAVHDDATGAVEPGDPGPLATNGRGLLIVSRLADRWGVEPDPDGKVVWAELDLPDFAPRAAGGLTDLVPEETSSR